MASDDRLGARTNKYSVFVVHNMSRTIKVIAVLAVAVLAYKFLADAGSSTVEYEP